MNMMKIFILFIVGMLIMRIAQRIRIWYMVRKFKTDKNLREHLLKEAEGRPMYWTSDDYRRGLIVSRAIFMLQDYLLPEEIHTLKDGVMDKRNWVIMYFQAHDEDLRALYEVREECLKEWSIPTEFVDRIETWIIGQRKKETDETATTSDYIAEAQRLMGKDPYIKRRR